MFRGIKHTGVIVSDIDKLVPFYCDYFGMKVKADLGMQTGPEVPMIMGLPDARVKIVMLEKAGQILELIQIVNPVRPPIAHDTPYGEVGHAHLAFETDDIDAAYELFCKNEVEIVVPPQEIPGDFKFFYVRDPDNQWVEVVQPLS